MTESAAKKGGVFTRYGLLIAVAIIILVVVLYLAGDFIYSTVRPETPTISEPVNETSVGENPPTFQGTVPLDAAIEIYIDDKKIATRNTQAQTFWNYKPDQQLEVGDHTLYVIAVGREGLKSKKSDVIHFSVPKRPQIASLQDGQTSALQPEFSGEAAAGAEVNLYIDNEYVTNTKADPTGKWVMPAKSVPSIAPGAHTAYVIAVKTIGEFKNQSQVMNFTIK